jgi:Holliday junction resolvase RusA-like endonuclease
MYDPALSKDWKLWIRYSVLAQRPPQPSLAPMILRAVFWLPRPKSLPKNVLYHTKKPDLDNLIKACKDALSGIFFRDDSQIIHLDVEKRYAVVQSTGVFIELEEV